MIWRALELDPAKITERMIKILVQAFREHLAKLPTCDRCGTPIVGGGLCAECHIDVFDRPLTAAATPASPPAFDPVIRLDGNKITSVPKMRSWVDRPSTFDPVIKVMKARSAAVFHPLLCPIPGGWFNELPPVADRRDERPTAVLHPLLALCLDIETRARAASPEPIWEQCPGSKFSEVIAAGKHLIAESLSHEQAAHVVATQPKVALALCAKLREAHQLVEDLARALQDVTYADFHDRIKAFREIEL